MIEITPAILEPDLDSVRDKLGRISGVSRTVQLDVCDGKFVRNKTWPYVKGGMEEFNAIASESEGLPFWDSLDFEVDLMVRHPEEVVDDWIRAGAKAVVLHLESTPEPLTLIERLREEYGMSSGDSFGLRIGVSINVDTPNADLFEILDLVDEAGNCIVDFVQFMGIAQIGYQGQELDECVLEKISDLRDLYPEIEISVDGGVNFETASELISAGANRLVSGSAIFDSDDIAEAIDNLKTAGE